MAWTDPKDIENRQKEGYDASYFSSLYRQMAYAFGEPWDYQMAQASNGFFPHWPDLRPNYQEIGKSRRITNASFIGLSKVMFKEPEPEFPNLDPIDAELRKQFLLARWDGDDYGNGNWMEEETGAFLDGEGLGRGFLQVGLRTGHDGNQLVSVRHSPAIMTLGDRMERSPDRWRHITFVHYIPLDIAVAEYGNDIKRHSFSMYDSDSSWPVEAIRIFEYYDLGWGKSGEPTMAIIPGDIGEKPLYRGENPFGCLPFSYYQYFTPSGLQSPIGRIVLAMATQEAINEVETYMLSVMRSGKGFDIASFEEYEEEDLKKVNSGKPPKVVRRKTPRKDGWERVMPMEMSQSSLALLEMLTRQFNADSNTTDYERGSMAQDRRTATEVSALISKSETAGMWSQKQAIKFRERTFQKVIKVAQQFDRSAVRVPMFGSTVILNDPADPNTSLEYVLATPSRAVVSEESMTYQDVQQKRQMRLQQLLVLQQYVGTLVNPTWWIEEIMKAIGEKDLRSALLTQEAGVESGMMGMMAGAPGMPMAGAMPGSMPQ